MRNYPKHRTTAYFKSKAIYFGARGRGWKPFQEIKTALWERRLIAKSLGVVLNYGIGLDRPKEETILAVQKIVPLAARELKRAMVGKFSAEQYAIFSKRMDLCAKHVYHFSAFKQVPSKMTELAKSFNGKNFSELDDLICNKTIFLLSEIGGLLSKERTSEEWLEYQLIHDIGNSLALIKTMLNQVVIAKTINRNLNNFDEKRRLFAFLYNNLFFHANSFLPVNYCLIDNILIARLNRDS